MGNSLLLESHTTELCSVPLRENVLTELSASSLVQDVTSFANTAKGEAPAEIQQSPVLQRKTVTFSAQPCSGLPREHFSKVFQLSWLEDAPARFFYSAPVNEDLHPRLFRTHIVCQVTMMCTLMSPVISHD